MINTSKINSLVIVGIQACDVSVQIHTTNGIPSFKIVGLADKTIAESRERVQAALSSIALSLPSKKILINLAPANLSKEGSHFDLPIALAILVHLSVIPLESIKDYIVLGELSLSGDILSVPGVLPSAVHAASKNQGIICPYENLEEAQWSNNNNIIAPRNLVELINHFSNKTDISNRSTEKVNQNHTSKTNHIKFEDIKGQKIAKRALTIAAAGNHSILMSGPPGSGKSMLARALPGIMPEMTSKEILECSMVYSVAGLIIRGSLQSTIPFRSPHHSASLAAIIGGGIGKKVRPGEISLAHNGVLFLDELPEFNSAVVDALREPMETQEVFIARSEAHVLYPANFLLIAAMNPCKCGHLGDVEKECGKAPRCAQTYLSKISGPILDRFAIYINVHNDTAFNEDTCQISSDEMRSMVIEARKIQSKRYQGCKFSTNARASNEQLKEHVKLNSQCQDMLDEVINKFRISMRGYFGLIKLARTIADLEQQQDINEKHIAEAISYRQNYH